MSSSCVREGKIFGNKYMLGVGRASIYIASEPLTMHEFAQIVKEVEQILCIQEGTQTSSSI